MTNDIDKGTLISIMEIERFAIHDGPGIRTVVFFQGCPLTCVWCSNPESQQIKPHLLYVENHCVACKACFEACQYGAIALRENNYPLFKRERCTACKSCALACPQNAIRFVGETMTVAEIMAVVERDEAYYRQSGGGITVSGGEAFVQFEGLRSLLRSCREIGINTAVETCGQTSLSKIREILPLVDLFLFDVKHMNKEKLKKYTGGNADTILANLRFLSEQAPDKVILRIPVIPGFNFHAEDIKDLFRIAVESQIGKVHLLPYHTLGESKYKRLGLDYPYPHHKMLTKEDLFPLKELGESLGLEIQV